MATQPLVGGDAPTASPPLRGLRLVVYILILATNIISTTVVSVALPMCLSGDVDMAVVFVYSCLMFFLFFAITDVFLDPFVKSIPALPEGEIALTALQNAVNGVGVMFGASSNRTPLTMQSSAALLINATSPFYKLWLFGIPFRRFTQYRWYLVACGLYFASFVLTIVDKVRHHASGSLSPYCLLYVLGLFALMTYNVQQERVQVQIPLEKMSALASFKVAIVILRKQFTWLFVFSWIGVILAFIPTFDQAGTMNRKMFEATWARFLPMDQPWMMTFLGCWVLTVITSQGVFMNKYDSSFNMLTSNISSVLALWTGWVPALMAGTVGFVPNVPLTVTAIILSLLAIYPSYLYSLHMRDIMEQHLSGLAPAEADERSGLLPKTVN